jgi:hypothetical protein
MAHLKAIRRYCDPGVGARARLRRVLVASGPMPAASQLVRLLALAVALSPARAAPQRPPANGGGMAPAPVAVPVDPAELRRFELAYSRTPSAPRPVFAEFLPILGSGTMLDYLERIYPKCHGEAHELGRAIFAARQDLAAALVECGARCSGGCMHGAVKEAFGGESLEALVAKMNAFCAGSTMAAFRPGNCAHAIGHAFMLIAAGDVAASLNACLYFDDESMRYYCSGGVFMELLQGSARPPEWPSVAAPCEQFSQFPAACYRYRLPQAFGLDADAALAECRGLSGAQRRGCYHGLGAVLRESMHNDPARLETACASAGPEELALCIEGAVDKLAEEHPRWVRAVCDGIHGDAQRLCNQALADGMYRLDKATARLYYDPAQVGERRPLAAEPAHAHHPR